MLRYVLITFLFLWQSAFSQEPVLVLPIGHTKAVSSSCFSSDGKKFLTASFDNTLKIWDSENGNLLADLKNPSIPTSVSFSPDGKRILVVSGYSHFVHLWDAISGSLIAELDKHYPWSEFACFTPDGMSIVTVDGYHEVKIWDGVSGKFIRKLLDSQYPLAVTPTTDSKKLMVVSNDSTVSIWDIPTGERSISVQIPGSKIHTAEISEDKKYLLTISSDSMLGRWDLTTGSLIGRSKIKSFSLYPAFPKFSPDKKKLIMAKGKIANINDNISGDIIRSINLPIEINSVSFSPKGEKILIAYEDTVVVFEVGTGKKISSYINSSSAFFAPDETKIALLSRYARSPVIFNTIAKKQIADLEGHTEIIRSARFSPDGKRIVTVIGNNIIKVWDAATNKPVFDLKGHIEPVNDAVYSPDGSKIVTISTDGAARISNSRTGSLIAVCQVPNVLITSIDFAPDSKTIVTSGGDSIARIWDIASGSLVKEFVGHTKVLNDAKFSHDGKRIVTVSDDETAIIWDASTGTRIHVLKNHTDVVNCAEFSPNDKMVVTGSDDETAIIWDVLTGLQLFKDMNHSASRDREFSVSSTHFSPDGKYLATSGNENYVSIWSTQNGENLYHLEGTANSYRAHFTPDNKSIVGAGSDGVVLFWDATSGKLARKLTEHNGNINSVSYSENGKKMLTTSADRSYKVWDAGYQKSLYTFFFIDSTDYLIVDSAFRFDGTETSRRMLYFICKGEVIKLDQLKDQLWVPGLAERTIQRDIINSKSLEDLGICDLTPQIEQIKNQDNIPHYKIKARRGGLGESVLYVNDIEVKRYKKEQLKKIPDGYELLINKSELQPYFIQGEENTITLVSLVADNTISSRGLIIKEDKTKQNITPPNLFAVMVGVSDYKGEELDLKYAAKDAVDMSAALGAASKKLFNIDNKQHVFTYNLTTTSDRYMLPEKISIKKTLEEIGKIATANDILLIFFAGHGIMGGKDKKQFYFLTADAARSTVNDAIDDVGISTAELTEWMKPANIKAQKRVLIFDACNSGQAIRDFVQLGKPDQGYIAARNDEKSQQIKAIEKLNNQSGLIILAASASDQGAYEMGRYSQGLLTYALLKVLKQQPEILESGKYLDVNNWLNAAKKVVSSLAEGTGARQEPQLNSNNNFNIGLVDEEVRNKITLAAENPLITRSNFQNADTKIDNLKLRNAVDKKLMTSTNQGITYSADYDGADAFTITGDYKIIGEEVVVSVMVVKGGVDIKHRLEVKGKKDDPDTIATLIVYAAVDWLKKNR